MANTRTVKAIPDEAPVANGQQPQMTPHQALSVLDQATMRLEANRNDHIAISTAIQVLSAEIGPVPQ